MAPPTWIVGQILAAADVNAWFVPVPAIKTSDQNLPSSTTLQNDTALFVALAATASYEFRCTLYYKGAANGTGDIKWTFTVPAAATLRYGASYNSTGLTGQVAINHVGTDVVNAGTNTTSNVMCITMQGSLTTAGTAGNLQLQWAQVTSNATATTVGTGSILVLTRVT